MNQMNVLHKMILAYMKNHEFYEETTDYDKLINHYKQLKYDEDMIADCINDLFDSGYIYEPVLGKVKVT